VLGAAPSGRAADELERGTDIPSQTLHALVADARREDGLPPRCVLIVDEAAMAETRVLAPVLRMVEEADGKALLVGDPAQLPSVGAGGLHQALCDRLGAVTLEENHRQREVGERQALARLREGDAEGYLAHAAQAGRLQIADDTATAKAQLLADWWTEASRGGVRDSVMLAHRRADVTELNGRARALMRQAGRLGERALSAGEREFRVGDRVVCRRNDGELGVRNGVRATVRDVEPVLGLVTLQIDGGRSLQLPERYVAQHLEHGYALTGHAAQGATVGRAFVLVRAEGAMAEWGYVAASRARAETRLYAVGPELAHDEGLAQHDRDAARGLADSLARSAAEPPAIELSEGEQGAPSPTQARRQWLEHEIDSREQLLAFAQAELDNLSWLGRRRHGDELREFIDVQHRILGDVRRELAEPPTEDVQRALPQPERSDDFLARKPAVTRELDRDRGNGFER
jgi:ATP-dependent exoDNAse (exonuclease V) alpha subunit